MIDGAAGLAAVALLSLNKKMGIFNSTFSLAWVVNGSTNGENESLGLSILKIFTAYVLECDHFSVIGVLTGTLNSF